MTSDQVGSECFCGDYLTKSHKKSDSECKMACKGKRDQACGDHWRVLIYRNPYYRCKLFSQPTQDLNIPIFCTPTIFWNHLYFIKPVIRIINFSFWGGVPLIMIKKISISYLYIHLVFTAILVTSGKCSIPFMKENNTYWLI